MNIEVLGTGSAGNCYLVQIGEATLLLECGLPFKLIQRMLGFKLSNIDACLITHEHMDHAKAAKDLMRAGVDCWMTEGTAEALGVKGHRLKIFTSYPDTRFYLWKHIAEAQVLPFETIHDASEPIGFYIRSIDSVESIFFVTDTAYLKYKIPECDVLMIECNYVKAAIDENVRIGDVNASLRNRIVRNHLSLETLVEALKAADLKRLKKIYLLHLSASNSDEELIKKTIQELTGVEVVVS